MVHDREGASKHRRSDGFQAFDDGTMTAIMDALEAHSTMSGQGLNSEVVRRGPKDILLGPEELYEALRRKAGWEVAEADDQA